MAYIGRGLDKGNYLKLDDLQSQFNGSTTTFNLTSGGTAFYPGSAFSILVVLAEVTQIAAVEVVVQAVLEVLEEIVLSGPAAQV